MKISIITICYNDPDIKKTCESIINQTYQDFQWVVIDGGSNNETLEILKQYTHRINVFVSEKDNGIYHAMNKGIRLAKGDYINFLNAGDCYSDSETLQKLYKTLDREDIIYGDLKFLEAENSYVRQYPNKIEYGWLFTDSIPHPASFIKKELFDKYGLYNENYKIVSDWEKWIEFIDMGKCTYKHIPQLVSVHNHNGISSQQSDLYTHERAEVLTKHYGTSEYDELKIKKYIKLLNIPIIKTVEKFNKTTYYLFGFLPIFKTVKN